MDHGHIFWNDSHLAELATTIIAHTYILIVETPDNPQLKLVDTLNLIHNNITEQIDPPALKA